MAFSGLLWPGHEHAETDYTHTARWSTWFNGPFLKENMQAASAELPREAHLVYSMTGEIKTLSAGKKDIDGIARGLRYYVANPAEAKDLIGTWVPRTTLMSGVDSQLHPVIVDAASAQSLGVKVGDSIALSVSLEDGTSNTVSGTFRALVTGIARPTSDFKGVALSNEPMMRFLRSAREVEATDAYLFGANKQVEQKLADTLAPDSIRGARIADLKKAADGRVKSNIQTIGGIVSVVAPLILLFYLGVELVLSVRKWHVADADGRYSLKKARRRTLMDTAFVLIVLVLAAALGQIFGRFLLLKLLGFVVPTSAVAIFGIELVVIIILSLVLRATLAHRYFAKHHPVLEASVKAPQKPQEPQEPAAVSPAMRPSTTQASTSSKDHAHE